MNKSGGTRSTSWEKKTRLYEPTRRETCTRRRLLDTEIRKVKHHHGGPLCKCRVKQVGSPVSIIRDDPRRQSSREPRSLLDVPCRCHSSSISDDTLDIARRTPGKRYGVRELGFSRDNNARTGLEFA